MTQKADLEQSFDDAASVVVANLTLGDRQSCRVLLPDGIDFSSERRAGRHQSRVEARVTATKRDIGEPPRAGERATLDYDGDSYSMAVVGDSISMTGGAFYSFTLSND